MKENSPCRFVRKMQIKDDQGLHTRPATTIAQMLRYYKSQTSFTYGDKTANAKSVLSLVMLAASKGSWVDVQVEGEDAEDVMKLLVWHFTGLRQEL